MEPTDLHFDVSTGLKSVLGSELITDDEVAIFELVKNSFDANASLVNIYFDSEQIIIADNGNGMSYDDIKKKWLFVAYSSKRDVNRGTDFRDIVAERRHFAGSKGIGRFSSDRLGSLVTLQTRAKQEVEKAVHYVTIDWSQFDKNHLQHFETIPVSYEEKVGGFIVPEQLKQENWGTVITIRRLNINWERHQLSSLKNALAKLINPFGAETDDFRINLCAPNELAEDERIKKTAKSKMEDPHPKDIINGAVGNFIFSTLQEKTTFIEVKISNDGSFIESKLTDRGELIYHIRELNNYYRLKSSGFFCQVFFLNTSAKLVFARRAGVRSVQFGSVFLFRNNFRVFPIGEEGYDWFGIDRRKQQGFARFLGTRDIIGRIDVSGDDNDFQEASSRNTGLIETLAVKELKSCFVDKCLKRLERYLVPVTFVDKEDRNTDDISRLLTDPGRARVADAVAKLVDDKNIELLNYSRRLIGIINEKSAQFENSLLSLRAIAQKSKDQNLFNSIEVAEKRFDELKKSEEAAKKQADEERKAKQEAQARAIAAEQKVVRFSEQLKEEKKRSLFLTSIASLDTDTILNLHHQVTIYAVDIQQQIENFLVDISDRKTIDIDSVLNALENISLLNRKILGVSKFATKANFRLESEKIEANLAEYIEQYINGVAKDFLSGPLSISVTNDGKGSIQSFKPIDVAVVIDNLITNARKARATRISFEITHPNKNSIYIHVADNGRGFDKSIDDVERIFEKGFTKTDGSGLGLYHVRYVLGEMNGTIEVVKDSAQQRGVEFLIRIAK